MSSSVLSYTPELRDYIWENGMTEHPSLKRLRDETLSHPFAVIQICPEQGSFMANLVRMISAKRIIEIGTYTGYSALAMALALPDDGKLITLDKDEDTNKVALNFFKKANLTHKIETIIKPALQSLEEIKNYKFDMVFIDADKFNYKEYYERSIALMNKGGLIIVDNVLWHGEVADETNIDKFTINIREFNVHVANDKRTEQIIVPLGDGMSVCRVL